mmetsp:Transcript_74153/g.241132  ORF Transcript_74153/g.241132 Transcript_74153/m.241132 type:complete len:423 (-) Transcript_74153:182-1450(-)
MLGQQPTSRQSQLLLRSWPQVLPILPKDAVRIGRVELAHSKACLRGFQGDGVHVLVCKRDRCAAGVRVPSIPEGSAEVAVVLVLGKNRQRKDNQLDASEPLLLQDFLDSLCRKSPNKIADPNGVSGENSKTKGRLHDNLYAQGVLCAESQPRHRLEVMQAALLVQHGRATCGHEVPLEAQLRSPSRLQLVHLLPILDVPGDVFAIVHASSEVDAACRDEVDLSRRARICLAREHPAVEAHDDRGLGGADHELHPRRLFARLGASLQGPAQGLQTRAADVHVGGVEGPIGPLPLQDFCHRHAERSQCSWVTARVHKLVLPRQILERSVELEGLHAGHKAFAGQGAHANLVSHEALHIPCLGEASATHRHLVHRAQGPDRGHQLCDINIRAIAEECRLWLARVRVCRLLRRLPGLGPQALSSRR